MSDRIGANRIEPICFRSPVSLAVSGDLSTGGRLSPAQASPRDCPKCHRSKFAVNVNETRYSIQQSVLIFKIRSSLRLPLKFQVSIYKFVSEDEIDSDPLVSFQKDLAELLAPATGEVSDATAPSESPVRGRRPRATPDDSGRDPSRPLSPLPRPRPPLTCVDRPDSEVDSVQQHYRDHGHHQRRQGMEPELLQELRAPRQGGQAGSRGRGRPYLSAMGERRMRERLLLPPLLRRRGRSRRETSRHRFRGCC
jgi:hypothetical protein